MRHGKWLAMMVIMLVSLMAICTSKKMSYAAKTDGYIDPPATTLSGNQPGKARVDGFVDPPATAPTTGNQPGKGKVDGHVDPTPVLFPPGCNTSVEKTGQKFASKPPTTDRSVIPVPAKPVVTTPVKPAPAKAPIRTIAQHQAQPQMTDPYEAIKNSGCLAKGGVRVEIEKYVKESGLVAHGYTDSKLNKLDGRVTNLEQNRSGGSVPPTTKRKKDKLMDNPLIALLAVIGGICLLVWLWSLLKKWWKSWERYSREKESERNREEWRARRDRTVPEDDGREMSLEETEARIEYARQHPEETVQPQQTSSQPVVSPAAVEPEPEVSLGAVRPASDTPAPPTRRVVSTVTNRAKFSANGDESEVAEVEIAVMKNTDGTSSIIQMEKGVGIRGKDSRPRMIKPGNKIKLEMGQNDEALCVLSFFSTSSNDMILNWGDFTFQDEMSGAELVPGGAFLRIIGGPDGRQIDFPDFDGNPVKKLAISDDTASEMTSNYVMDLAEFFAKIPHHHRVEICYSIRAKRTTEETGRMGSLMDDDSGTATPTRRSMVNWDHPTPAPAPAPAPAPTPDPIVTAPAPTETPEELEARMKTLMGL